MCGIAGIWAKTPRTEIATVARNMSNLIVHRGPDSGDVWHDNDPAIALAHRRLAIIDLSEAGRQPMHSASGRYVVVFNGEIYNHLDIRKEIEEISADAGWNGHSDTETIVSALDAWGLEGMLRRLNGMFAIAIWDRKLRQLHLARDRMGEKPLYYGKVGNAFVFGSELKALKAVPGWEGRVNRDVLALYLRHNCVPAPHSIYEGIYKLASAHCVTISDITADLPEPVPYWSLEDAFDSGAQNQLQGDAESASDELEKLLLDAVGIRMMADVPLGAFLSGGIDSSLIVSLMQAQANKPIKTFSIGFEEAGFNEAVFAKEVAAHLQTDHTEHYFSFKDAQDAIPSLPKMWDEPFADSSQIPTYFVSKIAREQVIVALSGDAGDELFCGYNRYNMGYNVWNKLKLLPKPARHAISKTVLRIPSGSIDSVFSNLPRRIRYLGAGDRAHKLAEVLRLTDHERFYLHLVSHFKDPNSVVLDGEEPKTLFDRRDDWPDRKDMRDQMMYADLKTYLPDDILTKVDRASMAVSLEARVPFLDHRVVEFAQRFPVAWKTHNGQSKWPLRNILYKYVDRKLIERPKMGFGIPLAEWLRGPLAEWAEDLLNPSALRNDGFFDEKTITDLWSRHKSGVSNAHYYIWDILMFQAWLRNEECTSLLEPA